MYMVLGRSTIASVIGGLTGLFLVAGFYWFSPSTVTDWLRPLGVALSATTLSVVALNLIWQYIWKAIPALNRIVFPDLTGRWNVTLRSNIKEIATHHPELDPEKVKSEIKAYAEISQSLFHIHISLESDDKYSNSTTVFVRPRKDPDSGAFSLYYIYENKTPEYAITDGQWHCGAAILTIRADDDFRRMEGVYWTNRNWKKAMNTSGIVAFEKS